MKHLTIIFLFLGWMIITLASIVTIIPALILTTTEWFNFPNDLLKKI